MPEFYPQTLAEWTAGRWSGDVPTQAIGGFCHDTRQLQAGDCFVALKTGRRDGHDFLEAAHEAGASAALVSAPRPGVSLPQLVVDDPLLAFQMIALRHRHEFPGRVVGVTGSCGKTSTKDLLARLLGPRTLKTEKNLNNTLGVPLTLTRLDPRDHDFAVVEAGINQPGEMAALGGMIASDVAVVTMIGPAHLEKLGSVENVAREKAELVRLSASNAPLVCGANCLLHEAFHHHAGEIFAVCRACERSESLEYTEYRSCCNFWREPGGMTRVQVYSPLLAGQFHVEANLSAGMVSNAVIATLAALLCGAKWDNVRERLRGWRPAGDRGSCFTRGDQWFYVDCYNANPASMTDALDTFQALAPAGRPRLYVLGGMKELGAHAEALHRDCAVALRLRPGDRALLVGEEAEAYAHGLRACGAAPTQWDCVNDAEQARPVVVAFDGAVFVKGSRVYALENALPADWQDANQEAEAC